ncbi:MAG: 4Fe-4S dicluster domain-containing protein [Candidatus Thorarchaeota archaeon]
MSSDIAAKEFAPKRKRMMDMIMVLGGLKEETVIPLSRVNEEISQLKAEMEPLAAEILAFPDKYYEEFYDSSKKTGLVKRVADKGVLTEAIMHLKAAIAKTSSSGVKDLLEELEPVLDEMTKSVELVQKEQVQDIGAVLKELPQIINAVREVVDGFEEKSRAKEKAAQEELNSLIESYTSLTSNIDSEPDAALEGLQKLGTKTRYGPFLRVAAQIKRGKKEERIVDSRYLDLIRGNLLLELRRGFIIYALNNMGSKTVVQLAGIMGMEAQEMQSAIISMIGRGEVEMVGLDGDAPVFARVLAKSPDTTLVTKRAIQQLRGIAKTLTGDVKSSTEEALHQLEDILKRLQILGEYDEPALANHMANLRETTEKAAEIAISSQASEDAEDLRLLVSAGLEAFARFRLKITLEKGPNLVSGLNVYGEKLDPEKYKQIMDSYLDSELERGIILILIRELGAMTAKNIAERTKIPQDRILRHLLRMKRDELLTMVGEDHGYILYDVPRVLNDAEIALQTACTLASQLYQSKSDFNEILADLKAETIGKLTNALEVFSRARDKMEKIEIDGIVVAKIVLTDIEDTIKTAVSMSYRTRARLPSTRPKVTIDDLMDVDVPSVLDEYRSMMGYAPLLGFGTVEWDEKKCLGCKSCEISCPEDAIELNPTIDLPQYFEMSSEDIEIHPVNKAMLYRTIRSLAAVKPTKQIEFEEDKPGFGSVDVDLWLCVACRTCVRRCPGPNGGALELDLKWHLPEVVRHLASLK